ncbi:MAG: glycine zipper 2TM domain-containing protein [Burkholderiaceae bacterium]|jgi:outer membrane lipoprotein SlyB
MKPRLVLLPALALSILLGACATSSPDVVRRSDAQRQSVVYDAVLLSIRNVRIDGSQSGAGAVTGAVVGGIAGSTAGKGRGSDVAAVLGAIAGAAVGNAVERANTGEEGEELLLQFSNGERRTIVQGKGQDALRPGDAVIVIQTGTTFRVVRAPARAGSPAPGTVPAGR